MAVLGSATPWLVLPEVVNLGLSLLVFGGVAVARTAWPLGGAGVAGTGSCQCAAEAAGSGMEAVGGGASRVSSPT